MEAAVTQMLRELDSGRWRPDSPAAQRVQRACADATAAVAAGRAPARADRLSEAAAQRILRRAFRPAAHTTLSPNAALADACLSAVAVADLCARAPPALLPASLSPAAVTAATVEALCAAWQVFGAGDDAAGAGGGGSGGSGGGGGSRGRGGPRADPRLLRTWVDALCQVPMRFLDGAPETQPSRELAALAASPPAVLAVLDAALAEAAAGAAKAPTGRRPCYVYVLTRAFDAAEEAASGAADSGVGAGGGGSGAIDDGGGAAAAARAGNAGTLQSAWGERDLAAAARLLSAALVPRIRSVCGGRATPAEAAACHDALGVAFTATRRLPAGLALDLAADAALAAALVDCVVRGSARGRDAALASCVTEALILLGELIPEIFEGPQTAAFAACREPRAV
jgi:uncharacterized membrane protein YgcG